VPAENVAPNGALEVTFGSGPSAFRMILVRSDDGLQAYLNICPHLALPLNRGDDRFLSADGQFLECRQHFAHFRISDGQCMAGPCLEAALDQVPVEVDPDGDIVIALPR
jgi:nitrite reductase/ring-hydroxylating ferredoxin subunit